MTPQERDELYAMVQMLMASNSPQPSYESIAPPMNKYGQPEPWDLDAQSKAYNVVQDHADIYSDPAIIGTMMSNTITPEMFQPSITYEPLKGWNMVEATANNQPNSLSGMIAQKIMTGQDAFAAYTEIVNILSDEGSDEYMAVAPLVPPRLSDPMAATNDPLARFDLDAVKKLADQYQSAINSEPIPQIDPNTNDFIRDQSGRIATTIEEESPTARWHRETGTPSPFEEWTTDQFASPLQQTRRDESFANTASAEDEWRDFRSQNPARPTLTGADRGAYITNMMKANMTTPDYPGFTNQSNRTSDFEGRGGSAGAWDSAGSPSGGGGNTLGFLGDAAGDAANLFGKGMALAVNPLGPVVGRLADFNWGDPFPVSETRSGGSPDLGQPTTTSRVPTRRGNASDPPAFRGDASWATPGGGSREGQGPARGSRYEAELRLREEEKRRGPTGREATPQSKKEFAAVRAQRAKNHKQLADEALRRRMIEELMGAGITPNSYVMNSRRSGAQQAGFGY